MDSKELNDKIKEAIQVVHETNDQADELITDLHHQHERIDSTHQKLLTAENHVANSQALFRKILRGFHTDKILMISVLVLIVVVVLLMLFYKHF